jgi:transmembrane sensor
MSTVVRGEFLAPRAEQAATWCMRVSEGPLAADDQVAFDAWLAESADNRAAFDEAVCTWQEIDGADTAAEFIDLRVEALQTARRGRRAPWTGSRRQAAALAILVVGLSAGGLWWVRAPTIYETGVGERRVAALADGSKISLDAATRVEVRLRRDHRDLRLISGRAKFDVARDPLRPFSVSAADKVVVATGTAFSVELLKRQVRVVLYEGHVAVLARPPQSDAKPQPVRLSTRGGPADQALSPGQELVSAVDGTVGDLRNTDPGQSLAWEAGQVVFIDEPLRSAVERVNRYSDQPLTVGDAAAANVLVTGVFTAGDTRAFVEGVTTALPLRAQRRDGKTVLTAQGHAAG